MTTEPFATRHPVLRVMRVLTITGAVVTGSGLILLAATLGSCSAFGGRCPADRPSLWDDDVFGMAAFGAALIVAVPVFLHRPSWRRLGVAAGVGVAAALIVGLLVTNAAHG
jgi:hypothetical protein